MKGKMMLTAALTFAALSLSVPLASQSHSKPASKLAGLPKLLGPAGVFDPLRMMGDALRWQLLGLKQEGVSSPSQASVDLQNWLTIGHSPDEAPEAEFDLVNEYSRSLSTLLAAMKYVGNEEGELLYQKGGIPFVFADHEGSLTLVLSAVASGDVYNTVRLSDEERAYKAT